LLVLGAGGHGAVVAEAAVEYRRWSDIVFLDDSPAAESVLGLPVLGSISDVDLHVSDETDVFVAIGDNANRLKLLDKLTIKGCSIVSIIHPTAIVSPSATIGAGSVICAGVIVNPRVEIGQGVILNTACTVDHDCVIGEGVHVSPGANLAGNVSVGSRSWIGIGAAIREGISIGADAIVGAGSAVVSDVADALTVGGVPARKLSTL
jgi:sugar O-acyltransferase (sialic acid O-acetyltransferase NeuD family)